jgi:hypothetical protein
VLNPILFNETAVPFIDTVELETVALKVAVWPAAGKAAVQLLLLFQESLDPLPVHAPLRAWAVLTVNDEAIIAVRMPSVVFVFFIGS